LPSSTPPLVSGSRFCKSLSRQGIRRFCRRITGQK
jgi:hypothetical protein